MLSRTALPRHTEHTQEDEVHAALIAAGEAGEVVNHLPFPPVVFGLGAFGVLMAMLAVTFAFRSVGTRH